MKTYANGDKYEGDFVDDKKHGKGVYVYANGDKYEGDWLDGKKHGKGVITFADGNKYEGDFVDGKFHGKGYTPMQTAVISSERGRTMRRTENFFATTQKAGC